MYSMSMVAKLFLKKDREHGCNGAVQVLQNINVRHHSAGFVYGLRVVEASNLILMVALQAPIYCDCTVNHT